MARAWIVVICGLLVVGADRCPAEEAVQPAETLTVAVVTSQSAFGDVEANLAHFESLVEQAAAQGARLVCFPELALVGFSTHPNVLKAAQPVPGPASRTLESIAAKHNVYLSVGIAERDGENYHVTQIVVGPDGYLGKYRKHYPTSTEQACGFSPGSEYPTWDIDGFRFGVLICYDGRNEDTILAMKQAGVDIIHHPHGNGVGKLGQDAETWTRSKLVYHAPRAITARAYILINNSAAEVDEPTGPKHFSSGAIAIDSLGQSIVRTTQNDRAERMIVTTLTHPLNLVPPGELSVLAQDDPDIRKRVEGNERLRKQLAKK